MLQKGKGKLRFEGLPGARLQDIHFKIVPKRALKYLMAICDSVNVTKQR